MNKINISICTILILMGICFAQGGIYSIVDPEGMSFNKFGESTLEAVISDTIKDIAIIEYCGGWKDKDDAKKQLIDKLQGKKIRISSAPLWNMDIPVELVGVIEYTNGYKGKLAIAQHRVGFQDNEGTPWYFQWDERITVEMKKRLFNKKLEQRPDK